MVKKFFVALAATAALISTPAIAGKAAPDGYEWIERTHTHDRVKLQVQTFPSITALRAFARENGVPEERAKTLLAFSAFSDQSIGCEIYIVDPEVMYMPEQLGHELSHCLFGHFHGHNLMSDPNVAKRYKAFEGK